jgi:hypothetical protein
MSLSPTTTRELVLRYGREGCIDARDELEHRGVLRIRTANPSGEYAEHLVEAALGGNAPTSTSPTTTCCWLTGHEFRCGRGT